MKGKKPHSTNEMTKEQEEMLWSAEHLTMQYKSNNRTTKLYHIHIILKEKALKKLSLHIHDIQYDSLTLQLNCFPTPTSLSIEN